MSDKPLAFITGAARGIGRATAIEFARRGHDIALLDVLDKPLRETEDLIRQAGAATSRHVVDLQDLSAAEAAVRRTAREFGRIDVLVNNAAWRELLTMRQITLQSWEKSLRISLTAPAFLSKWAAETMQSRGRGVIINVSSIYSRRGAGISPSYVAAKGGLDALTYELAALYGRHGIRVVAVNPGAVDTEMSGDYAGKSGESLTDRLVQHSNDLNPIGRVARPEEIARFICMLASEDASYVNGATIRVDGGLGSGSMMPNSLKKMLHPDEFK